MIKVASVAVFNGDKLLMGKRRDSGKWTLPGGHFEDNETAKEAAYRELKEETGIEVHQLMGLGSKQVVSEMGKRIQVHAFKCYCDKTPTIKFDPDEEVKKWQWIDVSNGIPEEILNNQHCKKNVVFQFMGFQKSMRKSDMFFIKSKPHKYIRKFRRGENWIYIYHEGSKKGRIVDKEFMKTLHKLAKHNHAARDLIDTAEEHKTEKIDILHKLSQSGHRPSKKHLKNLGLHDYLESEPLLEIISTPNSLSGQDKKAAAKFIKEAVDSSIFGYFERHGYQNENVAKTLKRAKITIDTVMSSIKDKRTISGMITGLNEEMRKIEVVHTGVTSQNQDANRVGGYGSLAFNTAISRLKEHDFIPRNYNYIRNADNRDNLTIDFDKIEEHVAGRAARVREEKERLRREAGELVGFHGQSVDDMSHYFGKSLSETEKVKMMKSIHYFFGKDFRFNKFIEHTCNSPAGVTCKLQDTFFSHLQEMGGRTGRGQVSAVFKYTENSTGNPITTASRWIEKNSDGSLLWHNSSLGRASNSNLEKYPNMAKGLYSGVEKFMKEVTANYPEEAKMDCLIEIGQCYAGGWGNTMKGNLIWAKHCFDFKSGSSRTVNKWKNKWKLAMDGYSRRLGLSADEVRSFNNTIDEAKYPVDFVRTGLHVNKEEAERAIGKSVDWDFKRRFRKDTYVDIGEIIAIDKGDHWSGENYFNRTTGRPGELNARRDVTYNGERAERVGTVKYLIGGDTHRPRRTAPPTRATGPPSSRTARGPTATPRQIASEMAAQRRTTQARQNAVSGGRYSELRTIAARGPRVRNAVFQWITSSGRITITEARIERMKKYWPTDAIRNFAAFAPISQPAKAKLRTLIRERER